MKTKELADLQQRFVNKSNANLNGVAESVSVMQHHQLKSIVTTIIVIFTVDVFGVFRDVAFAFGAIHLQAHRLGNTFRANLQDNQSLLP